jgi:hypothetical protein
MKSLLDRWFAVKAAAEAVLPLWIGRYQEDFKNAAIKNDGVYANAFINFRAINDSSLNDLIRQESDLSPAGWREFWHDSYELLSKNVEDMPVGKDVTISCQLLAENYLNEWLVNTLYDWFTLQLAVELLKLSRKSLAILETCGLYSREFNSIDILKQALDREIERSQGLLEALIREYATEDF